MSVKNLRNSSFDRRIGQTKNKKRWHGKQRTRVRLALHRLLQEQERPNDIIDLCPQPFFNPGGRRGAYDRSSKHACDHRHTPGWTLVYRLAFKHVGESIDQIRNRLRKKVGTDESVQYLFECLQGARWCEHDSWWSGQLWLSSEEGRRKTKTIGCDQNGIMCILD